LLERVLGAEDLGRLRPRLARDRVGVAPRPHERLGARRVEPFGLIRGVESHGVVDVLGLHEQLAARARPLLAVELREREAAGRESEHERGEERAHARSRRTARAARNMSAMTAVAPLRPPAENVAETATYVAQARAKRSFNTILDARRIFSHGGRSVVTTTPTGEGDARRVLLKTDHPLQGGSIVETFELDAASHLVPLRLERRVL